MNSSKSPGDDQKEGAFFRSVRQRRSFPSFPTDESCLMGSERERRAGERNETGHATIEVVN